MEGEMWGRLTKNAEKMNKIENVEPRVVDQWEEWGGENSKSSIESTRRWVVQKGERMGGGATRLKKKQNTPALRLQKGIHVRMQDM